MKVIRYFLLSMSIGLAGLAHAADTDIYGVSTIDIKPNVLIIFDNSGSMGTKDVPGEIYDPATDYSFSGGKNRYDVQLSDSNWNTIYFSGLKLYNDATGLYEDNPKWQCDSAKNALLTKGYWNGKIAKHSVTGVVTCTGNKSRTLRLGNFHNFDLQDLGDSKTRIEVAKRVIANLIHENADDVRFGLMKFNAQTPYSYYNGSSDKQYESGFIMAGCGASKNELIGNYDPATTIFTDSDQSASFGAIGGMYSDTYTPLSETMAEAGRYFAGVPSWFNGGTTGTGYPYGKFLSSCAASSTGCRDYSTDTPIQYRCQKNFIIFMTDGEPTLDGNAKLKNDAYINGIKIPAAGKDGVSNYLDDVAYFLAHNDLLTTGANPSEEELIKKGEPGDFEYQTVTTYTIGFKQNLALLQNAANNGGGKYYTADDTSTLNEALSNIISEIKGDTQSFSAAAVPVSRANKAYSGNFVYYGLFQPTNSGNWVGNLKKYGITDLGVIVDKNGLDIVSGGTIISNAQSYWSPAADGADILRGGAAAKLLNDLEQGFSRKIYTYTGSSANLTDSTNLFKPGNSELLNFNTNLTDPVIGDIRHDNDELWPIGSLLHSQPLVVHYDTDNNGSLDYSVIYAGANDGMLHAFDDNDGSEKWAYVPQDLLGNIHTLPYVTSLQHYVDGTPSLYKYDHDNNSATQDKKILIFGERRGGNHYTALDISDHTSPMFKYQIKPDIFGAGLESLGQSWGTPQSVSIFDPATNKNKDVLVLPGGYDTNQDSLTPIGQDSVGRAVFAVDSQTGALQTSMTFSHDTFPQMTHSIVSVAPFENPKSRTTTRLYAGDMNGNLFAFRDDIFHRNVNKANASSFNGLYDGQEDGVWEQKIRLYSSPGKKIFYAPNILNVFMPITLFYPPPEADPFLEKTAVAKRVGDFVFYGTGDREHPEDITTVNEFYAIKNNWQWFDDSSTAAVDESVLPNITKAYIDVADGTVKSRIDNSVIIDRDSDGKIIDNPNTVFFLLDITDDIYQSTTVDEDTQKQYQSYVTETMNHSSNKGWYLRFVEPDGSEVGEQIVSSPIIFGGVVYFSTYIPEPPSGTNTIADPCANPGAKGSGYLYAIGARFGEAVIPSFNPSGPDNKPVPLDRRRKIEGKGIPPEPVLVVHEGKPTIVVGFDTVDPKYAQSVDEFYWRQM